MTLAARSALYLLKVIAHQAALPGAEEGARVLASADRKTMWRRVMQKHQRVGYRRSVRDRRAGFFHGQQALWFMFGVDTQ